MSVLFPLLLLTYPLVLHLGVYLGQIDLAVFYLALLLSLPFLSVVLTGRKPGIWVALSLVLALTLIALAAGNEQLIVKLVPLTVNGSLLWLFSSTLVSDRTPLITRFASLMRDDMPPAVLRYTRWATVAWSVYFLVMFILSLTLSLYAPIELWSLFSNALSYVFLALMFLGEFAVRRRLVHEHMDYSFREFLQRLRQLDFHRVIRP